MSLPTVARFKTGDNPPAKELDISGEISKRITEDFGVSIGDGSTQIRQPGSPTIAGFGNLETAFQYELLKEPTYETAMLLGLASPRRWANARWRKFFRKVSSGSSCSKQSLGAPG
jgi:hypothetical protein